MEEFWFEAVSDDIAAYTLPIHTSVREMQRTVPMNYHVYQ